LHEGVEHVGLGALHERQVGLVGDLQRSELAAVAADDGADQVGPAVDVEADVAQAAEGDVAEQPGLVVAIGE
jgi:hypothetical protein